MAVCSVLRCTAPAVHVVRMAPPEVGVYESAVCDHHLHAINAGAEWTYDDADRAIYMGQDLAAASHHVVRSVRLSHLETLMPDLEEVPVLAAFGCRTRGSQQHHTVTLVLTEQIVADLIDALGRFAPGDRPAQLPGPRPDRK